ncbi:DUF3883 domain-containing protein [Minwuia sp.]|uniref:DUF3883 domain-containing protein n=1 Tax=Minwuia sp. TaxID=2493630 RepID=UPI003A952ADB
MAPSAAWTDEENDLIVADYFDMLSQELSGQSFNKTDHRRKLCQRIERSEGSVEYKHQNISAVLQCLGETWIEGYKPAFNFQMPLVEAVDRWLSGGTALPEQLARFSGTGAGLSDPAALFVGTAPTLRNEPPPEASEKMLSVARKFDAAERDECNRALGRAGEELVLAREKAVLSAQGRSDLSRKIRWVSDEDGDGAGYDIASFYPDGCDRLIEVKTTNGWERTPFHISRNELRVADDCCESWCLFRLYDFRREPKAFELFPPLQRHVELTATSFQASFC